MGFSGIVQFAAQTLAGSGHQSWISERQSRSSNPVADFTRRSQGLFTIPPLSHSASRHIFSVISAFLFKFFFPFLEPRQNRFVLFVLFCGP